MKREGKRGLPEISPVGWLMVMLAGLLGLVLGVYPLVAYPAVARTMGGATTIARYLLAPSLMVAFAALTSVALFAALTGERSAALRLRLAALAFAIAVTGIATMIGGLAALKPAA